MLGQDMINFYKSVEMLNEALSLNSHKDMAMAAAKSSEDYTGRTAAQRISDHVFGDKDRISIPLEHHAPKAPGQVVRHLEKHGYTIKDYGKGLAATHKMVGDESRGIPMQKKEVVEKIGTVLEKTNAPEDTKRTFIHDPARIAATSKVPLKLVISRHPHDIAAMSTGQHWTSCQTLGGHIVGSDGVNKRYEGEGGFNEYVPTAIAAGAHVAYLVKHDADIDKHDAPLSRMSLNPFHSQNADSHTILRPTGETYGHEVSGIHETLRNWAEKHFPVKKGHEIYERHSGVYPEGERKIQNFDHETSMERVRAGDHTVFEQNPDPKFLHAAIDHISKNGFVGMSNLVNGNDALRPDHYEKLMTNLEAANPSHINKTQYEDSHYVMIRKHPERAIQHGLKMIKHWDDTHPKMVDELSGLHADSTGLRLSEQMLHQTTRGRINIPDELRNSIEHRAMETADKHIARGADGFGIDHSAVGMVHAKILSSDRSHALVGRVLDHFRNTKLEQYADHIEDYADRIGGAVSSKVHLGSPSRLSPEHERDFAHTVLSMPHDETIFSSRTRGAAAQIAAEHPDMHHLIGRSAMQSGFNFGGKSIGALANMLNGMNSESIAAMKD